LLRDTSAFYYGANRIFFARDSANREAAIHDVGSRSAMLAGYTVLVALYGNRDFSYGDELLREARRHAATSDDREFLDDVRFNLAMDQGRPKDALRAAADLPERQADRMFAATFWNGDSTAGARQYQESLPLVMQPAPKNTPARYAWETAIFDLAQYELARGDTSHTSRAITQLRALPRVPRNPVESEYPWRLALVLDTQLAARAKRADAAQRLASLDSLLRLGPKGARIRLAGNLVVSRLWEQSGDVNRAYAAVQRWTPSTTPIDGSLYTTYLREQGRLAEEVGNREAAIDAYRRYLHLLTNPEPSVARDVASVKSELAKLERQSAGR
jgi:tetratricopeptide (TPR) repeat protein